MGKESILRKIDDLVAKIAASQGAFEERDVIYILVETYKIVERESRSNRQEIKDALPHLSFFRDWVVHTNLHDKRWYRDRETLAEPTDLLNELLRVFETDVAQDHLKNMWPSFVEALNKITTDQGIHPQR